MSVIKKAFKSIGRFFKKHWKKILLVAAVVFTAGLAAVGTAGFSAAMGTAATGGGGITGFLGAAAKTMVAGVKAIGGTLGIGKGASLAGFGGAGHATLGTGAAAQALGLKGAAATQTAGAIAKAASAAPSVATAIAPSAAIKGAGTMMGGGIPGVGSAGMANSVAAQGIANVSSLASGSVASAGAASAAQVAGAGGFWTSAAAMPVINGLMGMAQGALTDEPDNRPEAVWGVGIKKKGKSMGPEDVAFSGQAWNPEQTSARKMMNPYDEEAGGGG